MSCEINDKGEWTSLYKLQDLTLENQFKLDKVQNKHRHKNKTKKTNNKKLVAMGITPIAMLPKSQQAWLPPLLSLKKLIKIRLCLDTKDLNGTIKREHIKLTTAEEMHNSKYLSKLNASNGY